MGNMGQDGRTGTLMKIHPVACKPLLETEAGLDGEAHSAFTEM